MSTHMAKTWFADGEIIEQVIPEAAIYKREWVGLTSEDMDCLFPHGSSVWVQETVKIIEAKLKEKNGL